MAPVFMAPASGDPDVAGAPGAALVDTDLHAEAVTRTAITSTMRALGTGPGQGRRQWRLAFTSLRIPEHREAGMKRWSLRTSGER
jgi:hypothetical protein